MGRTVVAYSLPAALVTLAWLRLEDPRAGGADALWVVLLGLAPALLPSLAARLVAVPWVTLVALWVAFGSWDPDGGPRPGFFGHVVDRFDKGFADYYNLRVPFSGIEQPAMHGVLVLAIFAFCLGLGLAIASRRPLLAVLVLLAGAGWPATLLPTQSVAYGALILTAALWALASLRLARPTLSLGAGLVVVVAALGVSSSAAVAKEGVLAWQTWDPTEGLSDPVAVDYVWDANYDGIDFPKEKTTVLRIRGPKRSLYWRATTLEQFTHDRWIENLAPLATGVAAGRLPRDPLLPAAAADSRNWTKQEVEVVGLADDHIVAAPSPVAVEAVELGQVFFLSGGVVRRQNAGLERGLTYDVYSYAPRPKPAQLARSGPAYPRELDRYLEIERTRVAPFGAAGREAEVAALFTDERQFALWPYEGLYRQAARLANGARGPYGAAVAIETWLRTTGGFTYEEQPPRPPDGVPALADFVDRSKLGYCQQFAGSMALMLRFLGIPARVAAGFTSGSYSNGIWTVTDHNAHTWVEVWFPRFGWLSFDPTPGRGELGVEYSSSSPTFNAGDVADLIGRGAAGVSGGPDPGGAGELDRLDALRERQAQRRTPISPPGGASTIWILLALLAGTGAAIGLGKLAWRRSRYLRRDPRGVAGAARRELVDFLADQGLDVRTSATGEDLHELVRSELGVDVRPFAKAVGAARFGPPAASARAATQARRELRALLRRIRRGLTRVQRLRGFIALRSLRA